MHLLVQIGRIARSLEVREGKTVANAARRYGLGGAFCLCYAPQNNRIHVCRQARGQTEVSQYDMSRDDGLAVPLQTSGREFLDPPVQPALVPGCLVLGDNALVDHAVDEATDQIPAQRTFKGQYLAVAVRRFRRSAEPDGGFDSGHCCGEFS